MKRQPAAGVLGGGRGARWRLGRRAYAALVLWVGLVVGVCGWSVWRGQRRWMPGVRGAAGLVAWSVLTLTVLTATAQLLGAIGWLSGWGVIVVTAFVAVSGWLVGRDDGASRTEHVDTAGSPLRVDVFASDETYPFFGPNLDLHMDAWNEVRRGPVGHRGLRRRRRGRLRPRRPARPEPLSRVVIADELVSR